MKTKSIIVLLTFFVIAGCSYQNEEQLYNCSVDAAHTTYSNHIRSIFNSYGCLGCHGGGASLGGVSLETIAGVRASVVNGRLYGSISHLPGFVAMPIAGQSISNCDIKKVKAWIDAGTPDN